MKPSLKTADQLSLFEEPLTTPGLEGQFITREHLEAARQFNDLSAALDALEWVYDFGGSVREMLAWSRLRKKPR